MDIIWPSVTSKIPTGLGDMYVTVYIESGKPYGLIIVMGKSGDTVRVKCEVIGRLASLALSSRNCPSCGHIVIPTSEVIDNMIGLTDDNPTPWRDTVILSIPDGAGQLLRRVDRGEFQWE